MPEDVTRPRNGGAPEPGAEDRRHATAAVAAAGDAPAPARPDVRRGGEAAEEPRTEADLSRELLAARTRPRIFRILRWAAVVPLLVLFLIGVVTPIMPQFPFLLAALFLMAPDFPPARRLAVRLQRKLPSVRRKIPKRWRVTKERGP